MGKISKMLFYFEL